MIIRINNFSIAETLILILIRFSLARSEYHQISELHTRLVSRIARPPCTYLPSLVMTRGGVGDASTLVGLNHEIGGV